MTVYTTRSPATMSWSSTEEGLEVLASTKADLLRATHSFRKGLMASEPM